MITELYTVYRTELLRYCLVLCGNMHDADDLLQEDGIVADPQEIYEIMMEFDAQDNDDAQL